MKKSAVLSLLLALALAALLASLSRAPAGQPTDQAAPLRSALAAASQAAPQPPAPAPTAKLTVPLEVRETAGVSRKAALTSSGIPLPEDAGITDVSTLAVAGPDGKVIPADIRPTGWWRSRKAPSGIQWVQVSFIADLQAKATAQYKLLVGVPTGSNPAPSGTLALRRDGNVVTVNTGVATFEISPAGLFRSASLGGKQLLGAGETASTFNGQTDRLADASVRRVEVEYAGPLVAYVQTESVFPSLTFGEAKVSLLRRYEFRRGSGIVKVGERIAWEGTLNNTNWLKADGTLNGILGTLWSEKLALPAATTGVTVWAERGKPVAVVSAGTETALRQRLRENRIDPATKKTVPRRYEVLSGGSRLAGGEEASGGLVAARSADGTVVAALRQMNRYEPQGLYVRPGQLELRLADDRFWLAHHQGTYVDMSLALLPAGATAGDLEGVWAELNRPLRALADPAYYAVADFNPLGPRKLPAPLADYDKALLTLANSTMAASTRCGVWGLQTWAGWPWYWGEDCTGMLGTGIGWDNYYMTAGMTDYYSTSASAVRLALRTGQAEWLDELAFPTAWRDIHTQRFICNPADPWVYCGWMPAGYQAYRQDMNSSHTYLDGVFWYYFLTGDPLVLQPMPQAVRGNLHYITNVDVAGRMPNQHIGVMRFLGHALPDPAEGKYFSDLFDSTVAKNLQRLYIEGTYNGQPISLWTGAPKKPGTNTTIHLYAMGWDMGNLYWYGKRTGDPAAFSALAKLAKSVIVYAPRAVGGDGSFTRNWARGFQLDWDGGTAITNLANHGVGADYIYPGDFPYMTEWWSRAATLSGDPLIVRKARELVTYSIQRLISGKYPFGKEAGLGETRLSAAVAEEAKRP